MGIPTVQEEAREYKLGWDDYDKRNDYYFDISCDKDEFMRL
jgi:hypothetical protein